VKHCVPDEASGGSQFERCEDAAMKGWWWCVTVAAKMIVWMMKVALSFLFIVCAWRWFRPRSALNMRCACACMRKRRC
jgi:hypothetical protein